MSKKATMSSRAVTKALSKSSKAAGDAKLASDARLLAKDAVNAAIAAACAAERATAEADSGKANDTTSVRKVTQDARTAAEEAVEHAKDAMRAESQHDPIGAVWSANLSARAAQRAGSLASAAAVIVGTDREMVSGKETADPAVTVAKARVKSQRKGMDRELAAAIEQSARFLVTYDSRIIATFAREEDAFLLEGELADLDRARHAKSGHCEVLDRKSGHRLGGYLLTGGKMLVFVRNDEHEMRYGRRGR